MDTWLIASLILFTVGLLFVMAEVVVPSGGLLGLVALACLVGCVASAYRVSGLAAVIMGSVEAICVPIAVVVMFKILPKTSFGRNLFLTPPETANSPQPAESAKTTEEPLAEMLGQEGTVVTALRPSGTAEFSGRRISVVSDGVVVDKGRRVRIVLVEGTRVVVEASEE